jgi:Carbamoyl-phosphate synthase L chain, ATP binding domain
LAHTVLVVTTARWFSTARLAIALSKAGYNVEVVCPPGHSIGKTSAVQRTYKYDGLTPLMSITDAIFATKPDLIVPSDDLAARHLHEIHAKEAKNGKEGLRISELIERSIGGSEAYSIIFERTALIEQAASAGVRVPKTQVIKDLSDLENWVAQMGLPTVLKADGTSGGEGVRTVRTMEEAERAFRTLKAPPLLARAGKRALINRDWTLVWPSLLRRGFAVNAQAFIDGHEATSAVACWKGTVLAGLHFEVINKRKSAGPATVLRAIENVEMTSAAEKIVRRLNLSGLIGFDFMIERQTGNTFLIEMNPRATQVGHLTLGLGRDLPAALYSVVSGQTIREAPKLTDNNVIALFPHEWMRNPESSFLHSGYHDIPWEEAELIRACVRTRQRQGPWYSPQTWFPALSPVRLPRP